MDRGRWIPFSDSLSQFLPRDRAFTELEALYSLQLNYDRGAPVTVAGLASSWGWSRKRVTSFLERVEAEIIYRGPKRAKSTKAYVVPNRGTCEEHVRNMSGTCEEHVRLIKNNKLDASRNMLGTCKEHVRNMKGSIIIHTHTSYPYSLTTLSDQSDEGGTGGNKFGGIDYRVDHIGMCLVGAEEEKQDTLNGSERSNCSFDQVVFGGNGCGKNTEKTRTGRAGDRSDKGTQGENGVIAASTNALPGQLSLPIQSPKTGQSGTDLKTDGEVAVGSKSSRESSEKPQEPEENEPRYRTSNKKWLKGQRLTDFDRFWNTFGDKRGKPGAAKSWLEIEDYSQPLVDWIIRGAESYAAERVDIKQRGSTPKMAQGWLSDRRWEDYPEEPEKSSIVIKELSPEERMARALERKAQREKNASQETTINNSWPDAVGHNRQGRDADAKQALRVLYGQGSRGR